MLEQLGLGRCRIGIEFRHLSAEYFHELVDKFSAEFVPADDLLERTRAVKTPAEIALLRNAFLNTQDAIYEAWMDSHVGDSEKNVANRMTDEVSKRGADGVRHLTLASGGNTVHPHMHPSNRCLLPGDLILTDFGATWDGFSSDMARMGIAGEARPKEDEEYRRYREAYVEVLHHLKPDVTAADVYTRCQTVFGDYGVPISSPHVGHSVSRGGGHENPILHPGRQQILEPNMLIALEPIYKASQTRRYHLEDLVLITDSGSAILTDWQSTERMMTIPS